MERLCFFIHLIPGSESEYERLHHEMPTTMIKALTDAGFVNYSLFRRGELVVGYAECMPSVAAAFSEFGATEIAARWNEAFDGVIAVMTDEDGELLRADEVWHLT